MRRGARGVCGEGRARRGGAGGGFFVMAAAGVVLAAGLALAGSAQGIPIDAPTCVEDIRAAKLFRETYKNKSSRWAAALKDWYGAGKKCLDCPDDPCGDSWHGQWTGLECRGDWVCDESGNNCRWSGVKQAKGSCKRITNFHLPDRGLEGTTPVELVHFPYLHEIDIDSNAFVGPLPPELACISNMIEFDAEENDFTGSIPGVYGYLKRLVEFEVDDCRGLTGCIPEGLPPDERRGYLSFTTDPYVGTSYGGSGLSGERCPNGPFNLDCAAITKLPEDAPWPNWYPNPALSQPAEPSLTVGEALGGGPAEAESEPAEPAAEAGPGEPAEPIEPVELSLNSVIATRGTGGRR